MSEILAGLIGREFPVLDRGSVTLIDVMGDDAAVCGAARVSFGAGTRIVSTDRDLIRYLMRHRHGTPFEMAEIKLRVLVPMDCWRQWIRHRTANVNEYSTRYSEAIDAAQVTPPDGWRAQAKANKQGSAGFVTGWPAGFAVEEIDGDLHDAEESDAPGEGWLVVRTDPETGRDRGFRHFDREPTPGLYLSENEADLLAHARAVYEERLKFGVAREQARKDLPLSTYTAAVWKCDLRNVFHFLGLRMDSHAQHEIRQYADVIGREIVAPLFPLCWEAFVDYDLGAVTLSRLDAAAVALAAGKQPWEAIFTNAREREECRAKLAGFGLIDG